MKLLQYFASFLENTVNLNQSRLDQLDSRVNAITDWLASDDVVGPMYQGYIPQGSWAHRTIIKPLKNYEFDADFLLQLEENTDWSTEPKVYLQQLRAAFMRSSTYADMAARKNRCVRIVYANECHVDVVPYLVLADGREVIINYADNVFEDTNPQGFTEWIKTRDDVTHGNLRKVIRLLKYLRDYKTTFSCPSVILTTLVGGRVDSYDADNRYADVPTTLCNLLADLSAWLQLYPSMPTIADPSAPGTDFNHRWDQAKYANLRDWIACYTAKVKEAYDATDLETSLALWQEVFGADFKKPTAALTESVSSTSVATKTSVSRAPHEEFIEEKFPRAEQYTARITCTVQRKDGFRHGDFRSLVRVTKWRDLLFSVVTNTPEPHDIYWKVRNTGTEAERANGLRGQLLRDGGHKNRRESTLYSGHHYVEVYIVKNGRVVAIDRYNVQIV